MTTNTTDRLAEALALARRGWHLLPIWPLNHDGSCACRRPDCERPGKHPLGRLVKNGVDNASTDPAIIGAWLAEWPDANLAVALAPSGLIDIAPDSPAWQEEFRRRGLPPAATYQSGGGDGYAHYLYHRPASCPRYRLCKSDAYDILATGFSILPPSGHASGRTYHWLVRPDELDELTEAPQWAVELLTATATRHQNPAPIGDDDEPPVRLNAGGLAWWTGERVASKPDGTVDRSATLWAISKELARAGATTGTIATALAERDQSLALHKFAGRTDEARRYHETAHRAVLEATSEPLIVQNGHEPNGHHANGNGHASPCEQRVAELEAALAERDAEIARLRERQSLAFKVLRNQRLQTRRVTAIATVLEVQTAIERGELDDDGYVTVRLGGAKDADPQEEPWRDRYQSNGLGDKAGVSAPTASRHTQDFAAWGFFDRKVEYRAVPITDLETGEIVGQRHVTDLKLRPRYDAEAALARFATFDPQKKRQGGSKPRCQRHPHAGVIVQRVTRCAQCHEILDLQELTIENPQDDEEFQDEIPEASPQDPQPPLTVERTYAVQPAIPRQDAEFHHETPLFRLGDMEPRPDPEGICRSPDCGLHLQTAASQASGFCTRCRSSAGGAP